MKKLPALKQTAYPLIGHSHLLVGSAEHLFNTLCIMFETFSRTVKGKLYPLWLGPVPLLFIVHPDSAEVILRSSKHMKKSYLYSFLEPWLGTGLLTSHGEKWKQRRRLITPSFHFTILQEFLDVMNEQSAVLIKKLKSQLNSKQHVDVGKAITMCALDIICETAMGQTVNAQQDENSDYVKGLYR